LPDWHYLGNSKHLTLFRSGLACASWFAVFLASLAALTEKKRCLAIFQIRLFEIKLSDSFSLLNVYWSYLANFD